MSTLVGHARAGRRVDDDLPGAGPHLAWSLREVRDVDGRVRIVEHARPVTVAAGRGR